MRRAPQGDRSGLSWGASEAPEATPGEDPPSGALSDHGAPLVSKGISEHGDLHFSPLASGANTASAPPEYVQACVDGPHPREPWHLATWPRGRPELARSTPARCGSWRCPACRRYRASVDFARIRDAFARSDDRVCFLVLTLDQGGPFWRCRPQGHHGPTPWGQCLQNSAYRALQKMGKSLIRRLRDEMPDIRNRWVMVVEQHRSGVPHANVLIQSEWLAMEVEAMQERKELDGARGREVLLASGWIGEAIVASGWGPESTADVAKDTRDESGVDRLAGYAVKVAASLGDDAAGEVAKVSQVPTTAPKNFRRLRSGVKFLPPMRESGKSGVIVRDGRPMLPRKPPRGLDPAERVWWQRIQTLRRCEVNAALGTLVGLGETF